MAEEKLIGKITHFYGNISVGIIELEDELNIGDTIHIRGATTDFEQKVESIQIEHQPVEKAEAGKLVGVKMNTKVREGDLVYKVF